MDPIEPSPVEPTLAPSPGPTITPPPAPAGSLCEGLVQDLVPHPMSPLAPPPVGQSVVDPEFRTRIRRVTAVPPAEGENAVIKPMYSTVQAWNANESFLVL